MEEGSTVANPSYKTTEVPRKWLQTRGWFCWTC